MSDQKYERCIERLAKRVGKIHSGTHLAKRVDEIHSGTTSKTSPRQVIDDIAEQLEKVAAILEEKGLAQYFIESEHGDSHQQAGEAHWTPYSHAVQEIRTLAESARAAAKTMPDPRRRYALPRAAEALLYLRCDFGYPQPSLSNTDPIIGELDRVCNLAGISRYSPARLRGAISEAMQGFDQDARRDYVDDILYGGCQG